MGVVQAGIVMSDPNLTPYESEQTLPDDLAIETRMLLRRLGWTEEQIAAKTKKSRRNAAKRAMRPGRERPTGAVLPRSPQQSGESLGASRPGWSIRGQYDVGPGRNDQSGVEPALASDQ
jgi:hypothetical protein